MPIVLAVTIALTAGCGGDDGGIVGLDPAVFELALVSGGAQTGLAGTVLDEHINRGAATHRASPA